MYMCITQKKALLNTSQYNEVINYSFDGDEADVVGSIQTIDQQLVSHTPSDSLLDFIPWISTKTSLPSYSLISLTSCYIDQARVYYLLHWL